MLYPRQESNLRAWLRRPSLYPLSYGGVLPWRIYESPVKKTMKNYPASGQTLKIYNTEGRFKYFLSVFLCDTSQIGRDRITYFNLDTFVGALKIREDDMKDYFINDSILKLPFISSIFYFFPISHVLYLNVKSSTIENSISMIFLCPNQDHL